MDENGSFKPLTKLSGYINAISGYIRLYLTIQIKPLCYATPLKTIFHHVQFSQAYAESQANFN